ncbi:PAS domain-containing protein [uncultured Maritimibacter sp.]|jgi:hypothetical protein|uniref:PAS domain-containing protein n=1 Tax=uncultured Maritimibacter sp. TaxID=991866 RepID=UPI000AAD9AAC|nr:PAS domain-containing protein [uncultured Maritimibacter sp.]
MKIDVTEGSNVVSIGPIRAQVHFPSIRRVETYWEALRNGRVMPARAEIDPRGISDVLEFAFILEKIAPGVARMRLAGMHLNDLMDMEVRGMPITAMFLPEARRALQQVLESVLESPAIAKLTLESDSWIARPKLEAQMILMPLKDEHGRPTRILGALQARGTIGRGPRRFRILSQDVAPILGYDAPAGILAGPATEAEAPRAFADAKAGLEGKPAKKAPFLRLVHDAEMPGR